MLMKYPLVNVYSSLLNMAQSKFHEFSHEKSMVDLSIVVCKRLPEGSICLLFFFVGCAASCLVASLHILNNTIWIQKMDEAYIPIEFSHAILGDFP